MSRRAMQLASTCHPEPPPGGSEAEASAPQEVTGTPDPEVLFALLSQVMPPGPAGLLTDRLLVRFGCFAEIISAPPFQLDRIEGITQRAVTLLKSVEIAAQRLGEATLRATPTLGNWSQLTAYLDRSLSRQRNEVAKALFLDRKNHLLADEVVSIGDVCQVHLSCRRIIGRALELNATAVILAHNHPSGDPTPSETDICFTRDFRIAAAYMDIVLHDHVIVGRGRTFSFNQAGLFL